MLPKWEGVGGRICLPKKGALEPSQLYLLITDSLVPLSFGCGAEHTLHSEDLQSFRLQANSHCANLCSPFLIKIQIFLTCNHLKTYPINAVLVL